MGPQRSGRPVGRPKSGQNPNQKTAKKSNVMKPLVAAHLVDKNSRTILKMNQLLELSQRQGAAQIDTANYIAKRLDKLRIRLNRRLIKLSKWADESQDERQPPEVKSRANVARASAQVGNQNNRAIQLAPPPPQTTQPITSVASRPNVPIQMGFQFNSLPVEAQLNPTSIISTVPSLPSSIASLDPQPLLSAQHAFATDTQSEFLAALADRSQSSSTPAVFTSAIAYPSDGSSEIPPQLLTSIPVSDANTSSLPQLAPASDIGPPPPSFTSLMHRAINEAHASLRANGISDMFEPTSSSSAGTTSIAFAVPRSPVGDMATLSQGCEGVPRSPVGDTAMSVETSEPATDRDYTENNSHAAGESASLATSEPPYLGDS